MFKPGDIQVIWDSAEDAGSEELLGKAFEIIFAAESTALQRDVFDGNHFVIQDESMGDPAPGESNPLPMQ